MKVITHQLKTTRRRECLLRLIFFEIKMKRLLPKFSNGQRFVRGLHTTRPSQAISTTDFIVSSNQDPISSVEGITIPELVWSNLALKENKIASECSSTSQKLTFGEVYKRSRSFAAALQQAGLKDRDVVSVVLPNIIDFPTILFGVLEAGGIMSPANPSYTADEIIRQVLISEPKIAITIPALLPHIRAAAKQCPTLKSIIVVGEPQEGCHTFSEMIKVNPIGCEFAKGSQMDTREAVALLPFSSGTTGIPKGVELTHHNICSNVMQYSAPNCGYTRSIHRNEDQDRLIGVLPFFHSYGLNLSVITGHFAGNHTLCIQKFTPETFVKDLRQIDAHVLTLVPPLIQFLVHHPQITAKDFQNIRTVQSGAAPLGASLIQRLCEKAGKDMFVQNNYGLTETSPAALVLNPKFGNSKIGSCGNVLPSSYCKVVDPDTGKALGPNQRGELCIKGPHIMKGYFKNEKATKEMIDSDNWLHSGDVAYYDEDECFYVVDRIKELIKVKGLQVAPAELEDLLRHHPLVADVAVIGIPDEMCGELPRAYIVPKSDTLSESIISEFLNEKISKHKQLKGGVEFVKIIPKAASGKILRRELKEDYLKKFNISTNIMIN